MRGEGFSWDNEDYEAEKDISTSLREKRMNICKSCESLGDLNFCKECNCFMPVKTWIKSSVCPLKKW